jgi:diguanylate cyclase (GGDEF)-like protein/PAS domain S-box-containing protein
MTAHRTREVAHWLLAVAAVAAVVAIAWFSKVYARGDGLSTVWLANGLVLGLMLSAPLKRWAGLLGAGLVGNVLAGLLAGGVFATTLMVALINIAEVAVAAWPLRHARVADGAAGLADMTQPRFLVRFALVAMLVAPAVSGALLVAWASLRDGASIPHRFERWWIAHALGMCIMAPLALGFQRDELRYWFERRHIAEKLITMLLVLGVAFVVFGQNDYPILFLLFPPLLFVAMRGGLAATAAALLTVAIIAVGFTNAERGPLTLMQASPIERFLLLELVLGALVVTLFPVVVMLAQQRRAQRAARASELRFRMLADNSSDVILLTDVDGRRIYVSPAVREVFGWEPEEFLRGELTDLVHPDDLAAVRAQANPPDSSRLTLVFRGRKRDGTDIWVEALIARFSDQHFPELAGLQADQQSRPFNHGEDGLQGRVVTLRDVSRRRLAEQQLEAANRELASLVWKDSLTGLANRRRFDEYLEQEWNRALRSGEPLAVILLDVDHFKVYNDCYGHQRGDRCLVAVSDAIASAVGRPADLAARYGGEEFAVVLPGTSLLDARHVAERIRQNLFDSRLEHAGSALGVVSVSVGVAGCRALPDQSDDALVKAADEALYRSKENGRNRTTAASFPPPARTLAAVHRP